MWFAELFQDNKATNAFSTAAAAMMRRRGRFASGDMTASWSVLTADALKQIQPEC
jgi:hypothetical protein